MLAPALGLGMAITGCQKESSTPLYSAPNADASVVPIAVYSAPLAPDASAPDVSVAGDTITNGPEAALLDLAANEVAQGSDARKDAASEAGTALDSGAGLDAGADLGGIGVKYIAQLPDAGLDAGVDLGGIGVKYIAPLPDAGADLPMAVLYMAQLPSG